MIKVQRPSRRGIARDRRRAKKLFLCAGALQCLIGALAYELSVLKCVALAVASITLTVLAWRSGAMMASVLRREWYSVNQHGVVDVQELERELRDAGFERTASHEAKETFN